MADTAIDRLRPSEFRKVELQSPADLQHLEATAKRAAREKIDRALPPSAAANASSGEGDVLRRRVEELVDEYIRNTFKGVRANVVVNGLDVELDEKAAQDEEFETLDTKLAERIRALEATKESLTEKVADLRRTAPSQAAKDFQEQWVKDGEAFESGMEQEDDGSSNSHPIDIGDMKRWHDVQASWNRGTESLVALKGNLTETVARLERAKAVVEHMGS